MTVFDNRQTNSGTTKPNTDCIRNRKQSTQLSESSRKLLSVANKDYERALWQAARNYQQFDHYDHSLFGLDYNLDQAVGRHQREAMLYSQGKCVWLIVRNRS